MVCAACGAGNVEEAQICVTCGHSFGAAPTLAGPDLPPGLSAGLAVDALAGRVIADRYVIGGLLGKGGAGAVYRARDKVVGEDIAIKVLQESPSRDPKDVERFRRELVTARKVSHPNVIRIHDMGMFGTEFFISMELLEGGSLAAFLRAGAPDVSRAVEIAIGICDGLQAAHLQGVVHRDIKPDNVIFDSAGVPKIMDFGLARLATSGTRTAGFSGTPFYMSPEQADGVDPTAQSDVYSLGVLLFELFTGRLPFVSDSLVRLIVLHTREAPPSPRSFRPEIPAEIEALILRCLEKTASRRPASAAEIAGELRRWQLGRSGTVLAVSPALPPAMPGEKRSPRRRGAALGIGLLIASAAIGGVLVQGKTPKTLPTPTPTAQAAASPESSTVPVVPSQTATAIALGTAVPTVTATPRVVVVATMPATTVPSPTPALERGKLSVRSLARIRLDVFIDGVESGSVPIIDLPIEPGTRVLQLRQGSEVVSEQTLDVVPGAAHVFMATKDELGGVKVLRVQ